MIEDGVSDELDDHVRTPDEIYDVEDESETPPHDDDDDDNDESAGVDFSARESKLYRQALIVYEEALSSPNEKIRLTAAKELVSAFTKRQAAAAGRRGSTYTQINITADKLREALGAISHGMEGGFEVEQNRLTTGQYDQLPGPIRGEAEEITEEGLDAEETLEIDSSWIPTGGSGGGNSR